MPKYDEYEKLTLKKFNVNWMKKNSLILIYGKRASGKSFLLRDIFYKFKQIPYGVVFSGTEELNSFFGKFIPPSLIYDHYDSEIIEKVLHRQKIKVKQAKAEGYKDGLSPKNNCFLVLDDCLDDKKWKLEKTIRTIFFNGRHYNLLLFLTMQFPMGIGPELRAQLQYVFIFFDNNLQNRRKLYDNYAGFIPDFKMFCNILDDCTKNHECLVIRNDIKSTKLDELLFYYKAKDHGDFRVGSPALWKLHDESFNEHYDSDNDKQKEEIIDRIKNVGSKKFKTYVVKDNKIKKYSDSETDTDD